MDSFVITATIISLWGLIIAVLAYRKGYLDGCKASQQAFDNGRSVQASIEESERGKGELEY
jgi:hypothetical protein